MDIKWIKTRTISIKSDLSSYDSQDGVEQKGLKGPQDPLEVQLLPGLQQQRGDEVQAAEGDAQRGDKRQAALCRGRLRPTGDMMTFIFYKENFKDGETVCGMERKLLWRHRIRFHLFA